MIYKGVKCECKIVSLKKFYDDSIVHYHPKGNILDVLINYIPNDDYPIKIIYFYEKETL